LRDKTEVIHVRNTVVYVTDLRWEILWPRVCCETNNKQQQQ